MEQLTALVWIASAIAAALVGSSKGEAGMGFLFGLGLGPIGLLLAIVSRGDRVDCPSCGEPIRRRAIVCKHCGRDVSGAARSVPPVGPSGEAL